MRTINAIAAILCFTVAFGCMYYRGEGLRENALILAIGAINLILVFA